MMTRASLWQWLKKTWPDWLNLTVGAWMIFSAFVPSFAGPPAGAWASGVSGLAIAAVSAAAIVSVEFWKEWTNLALGLWLVGAPWALGFADQASPFWNFVLDGLFLVGHAGYQIVNPPHRRKGA